MNETTQAIYNAVMSLTHEDLEEMFAREGYGCRGCNRRKAAVWWKTSGDTYCDGCKRRMAKQWRRLQWTQVAHRAA